MTFVLVLALVSNVSSELVAHYEFEGNTNDSSGNNHDGIAYGGPTYTPGKFGQALNFDGVDDYVEIADFDCTNASHEFTLAFWFKVESFPPTATNNAYAYLFSHGTTNRNNSLCVWVNSTGAASSYTPNEVTTHSRLADPANPGNTTGSTGHLYSYVTARQLADGQWHMYALTVSSVNGATIYIDGEVVSTDLLYKGAPMNPVTDINLGRRVMDATRYFGGPGSDNGLLDDVGLWDEALGYNDVLQIYTNGIPDGGFPRPKAWNPMPDGSRLELPDVNLTWSPGWEVSGVDPYWHEVYLGTDFNDVCNASSTDHPDVNYFSVKVNTIDPGLLLLDQTYYWRVDEVYEVNTYKGDIWSFTTGIEPPGQAKDPIPLHGATDVDTTTVLSWIGGTNATSRDIYFGTSSPGTFQGSQTETTYDPGPLSSGTTYYWRIDEKNAGGVTTGAVWCFTTFFESGQAKSPNPVSGVVATNLQPILIWSPGEWAVSHDVYFGTDANAVRDANNSSEAYKGRQTASSYNTNLAEPNGLDPGASYYWRIDEVNESNGGSPWKGAVWSFTVLPRCTQTVGPTRALGLYKHGNALALCDGFSDPPAISRVQGWWQCHASPFTEQEITRELEEFKASGMGGITIKDTWAMPRDKYTAHIEDIPFMSDHWLDMFAHIVAECTRLGLICRSRFGSGWNSGGPWVPPAMSSQVIALAQSGSIAGPTTYSGPIPTSGGRPTYEALQTGEAFVLGLHPADGQVVDVTSMVTEMLELTWSVPPGNWVLLSSYSKASGVRVMNASPTGGGLHHDHLSEAGTDLQLNVMGEGMLNRLGGFEDTAFDGFDTDSWEMGNPTWTPGFHEAFVARRGYDPVPYLPVMAGFHLSHLDDRFLFDYRTTVSDLIVETHYQRVSNWCRERSIALESEAAGGPSHTVPKDLLKAVGAVDIPMGELWIHGRSYVKIPSSAAHAYGKRLVCLEWLTQPMGFFAPSPQGMKRRSDEAFLLGGNYLCPSCVNYSPPEAGLPGWLHRQVPRTGPTNTWWPLARPFFDYMGRCCFMLQSGNNVAQVAVYRNFQTSSDKLWRANSDDNLSSLPKEYAFDYVNDDLIRKHMSTTNGQIVLASGATYQILYVYPLPDGTMPLATLKRIRDLAYGGATVVWAGPPPTSCPGLTNYPQCDYELTDIVDELWSSGHLVTIPSHSYEALVPILENSPNPPTWKTVGEPPLRFVHRRTADADIFFIVNRDGESVETPVTFRVSGHVPELWIPETGEIKPADYHLTNEGVCVEINLVAHGSVFVVFTKAGAPPENRSARGEQPTILAIDGPWEVEFPEGSGAPSSATFDTLKSWTAMDEPGIKYFDGIATYKKSFTCAEAGIARGHVATLDLGDVKEVCEISLNGELVGSCWHPPYRFDVTEQLVLGENELQIRVANLWHNRLVADADLPADSRVTRMYPESRYDLFKGRPLVESGLLGPVKILFHQGVLRGDFDADGDVDFADLTAFGFAWTGRPGDDNWNSACDISMANDHIIDSLDLCVFAANWLCDTNQ